MIRRLLVRFFRLTALALFMSSFTGAIAQAQQAERGADTFPIGGSATARPRPPQLPSLPAGVEELKFREFFKMPIGPRGPEPTEKLSNLDGKRVRILGYMVHQEQPTPGIFILSPLPVSMSEMADGPADDMPVTAMFVHVPETDHRIVPYTPRPLLLTGRLRLGNEQEPDGRVSYVRLFPDPPADVLPMTEDGEILF